MSIVYKNGVERSIHDARLQEFLSAGWTEEVKATVRPRKEKVEASIVEAEPTVVVSGADTTSEQNDSKGE
jgi:hypothetical protein